MYTDYQPCEKLFVRLHTNVSQPSGYFSCVGHRGCSERYKVDIGWKSFVIVESNSAEGCLDGWKGVTDIGTPFGDGIYRKKSVRTLCLDEGGGLGRTRKY